MSVRSSAALLVFVGLSCRIIGLAATEDVKSSSCWTRRKARETTRLVFLKDFLRYDGAVEEAALRRSVDEILFPKELLGEEQQSKMAAEAGAVAGLRRFDFTSDLVGNVEDATSQAQEQQEEFLSHCKRDYTYVCQTESLAEWNLQRWPVGVEEEYGSNAMTVIAISSMFSGVGKGENVGDIPTWLMSRSIRERILNGIEAMSGPFWMEDLRQAERNFRNTIFVNNRRDDERTVDGGDALQATPGGGTGVQDVLRRVSDHNLTLFVRELFLLWLTDMKQKFVRWWNEFRLWKQISGDKRGVIGWRATTRTTAQEHGNRGFVPGLFSDLIDRVDYFRWTKSADAFPLSENTHPSRQSQIVDVIGAEGADSSSFHTVVPALHFLGDDTKMRMVERTDKANTKTAEAAPFYHVFFVSVSRYDLASVNFLVNSVSLRWLDMIRQMKKGGPSPSGGAEARAAESESHGGLFVKFMHSADDWDGAMESILSEESWDSRSGDGSPSSPFAELRGRVAVLSIHGHGLTDNLTTLGIDAAGRATRVKLLDPVRIKDPWEIVLPENVAVDVYGGEVGETNVFQ